MPKLVARGAVLKCDKGLAPGSLSIPQSPVTADGPTVATVNDHKPIVNIPTFSNCTSQANPTVATATAAAGGVLTPMPCVPMTQAPWSPGSSVTTIDGVKALTDDSKCKCNWNGTISVQNAGSAIESD
ncbi:MAG: DUF4280 domain-containing protein [Polyangiaceae bacterium]|nr:DUF4280 domain-containing protein [Polyangiaceae bacterium]